MSERDITVLQDGQLAVATVEQTGTLITGASAIDTTCLVQTEHGVQNCVKTYRLNGGGGGGGGYTLPPATASTLGGVKVGQNLTVEEDGTLNAQSSGGTVDQTYDSTSTNAQSGTAVAEAVAPALKNTATGGSSVSIAGNGTAMYYATNIGVSSTVSTQGVAIGYDSKTLNTGAIAVGHAAKANYDYSIAIGRGIKASAYNAIQIGSNGSNLTENTNAKTLQVFEHQLLDGNTGKIPTDRVAKIIELTTTSVELASDNVYNGAELASVTLTLPATVPANFCCQVQFTSGATATTFSAAGIFFEGDECVGGTFTPSANHRYSIMIYNDGVNTLGFVYEK